MALPISSPRKLGQRRSDDSILRHAPGSTEIAGHRKREATEGWLALLLRSLFALLEALCRDLKGKFAALAKNAVDYAVWLSARFLLA